MYSPNLIRPFRPCRGTVDARSLHSPLISPGHKERAAAAARPHIPSQLHPCTNCSLSAATRPKKQKRRTNSAARPHVQSELHPCTDYSLSAATRPKTKTPDKHRSPTPRTISTLPMHRLQFVSGDSPQKMTLGDSVNNRQGSFPFSFGI